MEEMGSKIEWETLGIEPEIAAKWIAAGIRSPETVKLLIHLGVSPESIKDADKRTAQDQL